jgi:DNA adenine methylase
MHDDCIGQPSRPFLKWLGGKRWLTPLIEDDLTGVEHRRYIEPFLGGGAFYFHFVFRPAFLSDINSELINAFVQVRDNMATLMSRLGMMEVDAATYYKIRSWIPEDPIDKAVRFLYLNRTSFSGIYRVNERGEFNVPFGNYGRRIEKIWEGSLLMEASIALQGANIFCADFEMALRRAKKGDLVYCDPTYTVMHNNNGFRKYNEKCFSWEDQERLAKCCHEAVRRGANVIVSNAYHYDIKRLYEGFESRVVERKSVLCPDAARRKRTQEFLFISRQDAGL